MPVPLLDLQGQYAPLREEILAAIVKHVPIERDKVRVKMEDGEGMSTLEVDIEFPTRPLLGARLAVKPAA